ncbi:MAG: hypothetical protein FWG73_01315 [Planctomycetaceae bacterium]|nr:hypothetical protein [Planctomycetaceae bacterium]
MRGNAWQVTAIIAILLVVMLLIPLIIMGRNYQTMAEQTRQARAEHTASAQNAANAEREANALKVLIGAAATTPFDAVQRQHVEMMERVLPGENDPTRTYNHAVAALLGDLERERQAHRRTSEAKTQLESDYNHAQTRHTAALDQLRAEVRRMEGLRDEERRQFSLAKEGIDRQLHLAIEQQDSTLAQSEYIRHQLNEQVNLLMNDNRDIRDTNVTLAAALEELRNPHFEHPAGKIMSVDQRAGTAIINVGSADGLMVRTMFGVFHSGITGLSFRSPSVGGASAYCEGCQREMSRDASKASVEVMQILGPHRAEVRILDDILNDPIMAGDVIYSPIWKPGQRVRFALTAGMALPGSSIESGNEAVKRLIEMNGGIVDCWIDENVPEGQEHLQGELSDLTNFIVINDRVARELDSEVRLVQDGLVESARNRAVKSISLEDLLSRMGWRNMTPVYTFGAQEFTTEMRVAPQHPGTLRQSSNPVSPMFIPPDPSARLDARDTLPIRTAPGQVSPLFNENAPVPPTSSGRTSDLFRPRTPSTGVN